jgi:lambda family phage portal protein
MNLIDRAIASVSPGWAFSRVKSRAKLKALARAYDAAEKTRETRDWPTDQYSADAAALPELANVNARARHAVRNDWMGASIIRANRRQTIGIGLTARADPRNPRNRDQRLADLAGDMDEWFNHWAQRPHLVDVERRKTLQNILELCVDERKTTGNAFVIWSFAGGPNRGDDGMVPLRLQMFETEQLADDIDTRPDPANEVRGGIEVDPDGRPVRYWVYLENHPHDPLVYHGGDRIRRNLTRVATGIDAKQVLHLNRQSRVRETVSLSDLAPVLRRMHDFAGYEQNESYAKKLEAFFAFAITQNPEAGDLFNLLNTFSPQNELTAGTADGDVEENAGYRQMSFEKGMVPVLQTGEGIQTLNPSRPGTTYAPYTKSQKQNIAAGVGESYYSVTRDAEGASYGSLRNDRIEQWAAVDADQRDVVDFILRPIWELFHSYALLRGFYGRARAIQFGQSNPIQRARMLGMTWAGPPRLWLDPAKQAAATKILIGLGLTNHDQILNELGRDWRQNAAVIEEVLAEYERRGIPTPWADGSDPVSPSEPKPRGGGESSDGDEAVPEANAAAGNGHAGAAARLEAVARQLARLAGSGGSDDADQLAQSILQRAMFEDA